MSRFEEHPALPEPWPDDPPEPLRKPRREHRLADSPGAGPGLSQLPEARLHQLPRAQARQALRPRPLKARRSRPRPENRPPGA